MKILSRSEDCAPKECLHGAGSLLWVVTVEFLLVSQRYGMCAFRPGTAANWRKVPWMLATLNPASKTFDHIRV